MITDRLIKVTFQWAGIHCWPDAKGRHEYLSKPHRHLFKGCAIIQVFDNDRELEFLAVKDFLQAVVLTLGVEYGSEDMGTKSCEEMAEYFIHNLVKEYGRERDIAVEVSEDGENSAILRWEAEASPDDR